MVAILGFSKDQITAAVQAMYAEVATAPGHPFHFPVGRAACRALGYPEAELERLPAAAVESFAGVGYPFRAGAIRPGDRVLDIGAGSGTDTLIASRMVGEAGKVWALDITPAMLDKLRATLESAGIRNVEVIAGDAERIPLPDNSVDVVTSNGVLNLVPDKRRAFAEIFRVLRRDGHVQIADVVIARPVPIGGRSDPRLWAECVVGASVDEDYLDLFRAAGFADVEVLRAFDYFAASPSAETRHIARSLGARAIEVAMRRPAEAPAGLQRWAYWLHPRRLRTLGGRGLWGAAAVLAALVACYGTLSLLAVLSLLGVAVTLDAGLWAAAIAGAAALAAAGTAVNLRRHRQPWPLALAVLGAAVVIYVMFGAYDPVIEALAFATLVGAVVLDLYLLYRAELCP
jgi:ubiquinone/menaquinone biosynthesis C-methylase UbiE